MGKVILVTVLFTLYNLVAVTNGLSCYTCGHVESGGLVGYDLDESCKWGNKPNESFLQSCKTDEDDNGDNKFDFVCIQLRITGYLHDGGARLQQTNTQRGCAARLNTTSTQAQPKECRRGTVSGLLQKFDHLVGREYLVGINATYEGKSSVKICSCDEDDTGCWLTDEDIVEDDDYDDDDDDTDKSNSQTVQITFSFVFISLLSLLMMN